MTMQFSVIIPVFNGADTIGKAIESVLVQSYPAYEIIIIDDGSKDETGEIVQHYVQKYIQKVRYFRQKNSGVSAARNLGVQHSRGEWLAFLDADDWYYPDRLQSHADWISEDPILDFLTGDEHFVRPDGTLIGRSMEKTPAGIKVLAIADEQDRAVMDIHLIGDYVAAHFGDTRTLSMRRETFEALGGFPTEYAVCEDMHLIIRLCARSRRVGVICRPLAAYCIHEFSATRSDPLRAQMHSVAALESLARTLKSSPTPIRKGWRHSLHAARMDYAVALLRQGRGADAIRTVMPSLLQQPSIRTLLDLASIARGLR